MVIVRYYWGEEACLCVNCLSSQLSRHILSMGALLNGWLHIFPSRRANNRESICRCALEKDERLHARTVTGSVLTLLITSKALYSNYLGNIA